MMPRSSSNRTRAQAAAVCQVRAAFGSMSVSMTDRAVLLKKLGAILRDGSQDKGQRNKEPHVPSDCTGYFAFRSIGLTGPTSSICPQVESSSPRP